MNKSREEVPQNQDPNEIDPDNFDPDSLTREELKAVATALNNERKKLISSLPSKRPTPTIDDRERDLEKSELRWRTVFEKSKDGIVLADLKTQKFHYANEAWFVMLGYQPTDLESIGLMDIFPPEEIEDTLTLIQKLRKGKINILPELKLCRKDGSEFYTELSEYPIILDDREYRVSVYRDITERKMAIDAIQQNEALARQILNSSPDVTVIIDRQNMQIIDCNDEACLSLGYSRDELFRLPLDKVFSDYSVERLALIFDEHINSYSQTGQLETDFKDRNGKSIPVEIFLKAARHGKKVILVASARDLSERIRSSKALKDSEERYVMVQQVAQIGTWDLDLHTKELFWTDGVFSLFGQDKKTFTTTYQLFLDCVHPEDRQYVIDSVSESLNNSSPYQIEHRVLRPNGTVIWVSENGGVTRDRFGEPVRMLGLVQDITERKENEQQMQLLSYVVEHSPFLIIVTDPNGSIEYVNPKFTQITGYQPEEAIGQNPRILKSGWTSPEQYELMWQTINRGEEWRSEVLNKTKQGNRYWAQVSISSITDRNGKVSHFIGIQEDITDRKTMESELIQAKEAAEQANQAKSTFLASMSHELRTPLNSILGFSQILKSNRKKTLSEVDLKHVNHILRSGNLLLDLINDVLDLSKIESGKFDLTLQPISVRKLFIDSLDQVGSLAEKYQVTVDYLDQDLDNNVRADERGVKQIMINLLSNGIKYNRQGGKVTLSCQVANDGMLEIVVTDTGPGIAEEKMELLFQPFNRLGAETTNIDGTGIGLTITKRLVEMMAGKIFVQSRLGQGTSFHVQLPMVRVSNLPEKDNRFDRATRTEQTECAQKKKILYIEDNKINLKLMESILDYFKNLDMITAPNGEVGIEIAQAEQPDIILMDIHLPGMDGFTVLKKLKEIETTSRIPVVAVTAKAMADEKEQGIQAGFQEYVTKPIQVAEFKELITGILRKNSQASQE